MGKRPKVGVRVFLLLLDVLLFPLRVFTSALRSTCLLLAFLLQAAVRRFRGRSRRVLFLLLLLVVRVGTLALDG